MLVVLPLWGRQAPKEMQQLGQVLQAAGAGAEEEAEGQLQQQGGAEGGASSSRSSSMRRRRVHSQGLTVSGRCHLMKTLPHINTGHTHHQQQQQEWPHGKLLQAAGRGSGSKRSSSSR